MLTTKPYYTNKRCVLFVFSALLWSINLCGQNYYAFSDSSEALAQKNNVFYIKLSKKRLKTIPLWVFECKNLKILDLSKNKLERLEGDFSCFEKLEELDVSKNNISHLDSRIGELKSLRVLKMGNNEIQQLPESIGKLKKLEHIDLWSNELQGLPVEIKNLKNLKELDLRVIQFSNTTQKEYQSWLPNTKIYFSNACNCD